MEPISSRDVLLVIAARALVYATPAAALVGLVLLVEGIFSRGEPLLLVLAAALAAGAIVGAVAGACTAVEHAMPGRGRAGWDLLAFAGCLAAGTLACVALLAQVSYAATVLEGQAAVLDFQSAWLGRDQLTGGVVGGGGLSFLLAIGGLARRRGGDEATIATWVAGIVCAGGVLLSFAEGLDGLVTHVVGGAMAGLVAGVVVGSLEMWAEGLARRWHVRLDARGR